MVEIQPMVIANAMSNVWSGQMTDKEGQKGSAVRL